MATKAQDATGRIEHLQKQVWLNFRDYLKENKITVQKQKHFELLFFSVNHTWTGFPLLQIALVFSFSFLFLAFKY